MKTINLRLLIDRGGCSKRIKNLLGLAILFGFALIFFLLPINSQAADYTSGKSNNILISHRGYYECPENTLLAFETSGQFGYKYLETDIHMTKDNVLVCLHDDTINRTARNKNGTTISKTINIGDITYEQALSYDFGIYKGKSQKIPTFEEYIKVCKKYGITPFIEIKECNEIGAKKIAEVLKKYGLDGKSVVLAFRGRLEKLQTVKNYSPNEKYYILADDWYMNNYGESFAEFLKVSKKFGASYIGVYPDQYYKYSNLLKDYTVILYTINNPYRLEEFHVYGITTDSIASDGWKYYNGGFKYYKNGFM